MSSACFLIHEHLSRPMSFLCQYMTLLRFVCTYIAFYYYRIILYHFRIT